MDNKKTLKIVTIPDVSKNSKHLLNLDLYLERYDNVVFLGNYIKQSKQIYPDNSFKILEKLFNRKYIDRKLILLIGDDDLKYLYPDKFNRNNQLDAGIIRELNYIYSVNKFVFKPIFQKGKYIFSNKGVSRDWYSKNLSLFNSIVEESDLNLIEDFDKIVSRCFMRNSDIILNTLDSKGNFGSPITAGFQELISSGGIKGYNQVVSGDLIKTPYTYKSHNDNITFTNCNGVDGHIINTIVI